MTGGSDGKLRFWDVPGFVHLPAEAALARLNGEQWDRPSDLLAGHTAAVRAVAFSPDGRFLVSSADDKRVLVWVPKP